jgi:hypothetical protein
MSESKPPAPDLGPNRRKEIFRVVRGSKLTGQRGNWSGELGQSAVADSEKMAADDGLHAIRRVRLGRAVEDEGNDAEVRDVRRYSEPND